MDRNLRKKRKTDTCHLQFCLFTGNMSQRKPVFWHILCRVFGIATCSFI